MRIRSDVESTVVDEPPGRRGGAWTAIAAVEVAIAVGAVVLDVVVPSLVILALAGVSLWWRREHLVSLGLTPAGRPARMAGEVLGIAALWSVVLITLVIPALEHVTGRQQDLSGFEDVQGNLGKLVAFLALTWTVAAVGEEVAYRGFVFTRVTEVAGSGVLGTVSAVVLSSALFGFVHAEQGTIGVVVTFLDAILFSALRLRYRTLWAAVLAHGFNNTIGLVTLYLIGPVHGLW